MAAWFCQVKLGFVEQRTKGMNVGVGVPDDPFAGTIVHAVGEGLAPPAKAAAALQTGGASPSPTAKQGVPV